MALMHTYECEKCGVTVEIEEAEIFFQTSEAEHAEHGLCLPCFNSEDDDKPIQFRAIKDIFWEDWGHMRRVFNKGRIYQGTLHQDGTVTAETPYYHGVSDFVDKDSIELLQGSTESERGFSMNAPNKGVYLWKGSTIL